MENDKYKSQIKHLRNNYKRFHIDFKIDTFEEFQKVCKKKKTTPTTVIKEFINNYIRENS